MDKNTSTFENKKSSTVLDFIHQEITQEYIASHYSAATNDLNKEEFNESQFFWGFLKELSLKVHTDFFKDFQLDDGFQIVDRFGRLTYFSLNIASLLKFDLEHVLNTPFDELFERDAFTNKRILEIFTKIMTQTQSSVYDLTNIPKHVVRQIGFPNDSYTVNFKKAYPVYTNDHELYGYVLRLDVKRLDH